MLNIHLLHYTELEDKMPSTYQSIVTGTLSGTPTSFTLSSIPSGYTDLVLVAQFTFGSSYGGNNYAMYVNGDTSTLYSVSEVGGSGASIGTGRQSGVANWLLSFPTGSPTTADSGLIIGHFNNYANTNINKTAMIRTNVPANDLAPGLQLTAALYRSSSAITSITLIGNSGSTLATGKFTLYGIQAA